MPNQDSASEGAVVIAKAPEDIDLMAKSLVPETIPEVMHPQSAYLAIM